MLPRLCRCFLLAMLLAVLFKPIECLNSNRRSSRLDRSSLTDARYYSSKEANENWSRRTQQLQSPHFLEDGNAAEKANTDTLIKSIFKTDSFLPNEITIFNTTPIERPERLQAPPIQEQTFKVQRSPDGKLNLVFNDFLLLQNPSVGQSPSRDPYAGGKPTPRPIRPQSTRSTNGREHGCEESIDADGILCTEVKDYPDATQLRNLLSRDYPKYGALFTEDMVVPQNITQRINLDNVEKSLCRTDEKIVYPKRGQTKEGIWLFIINVDDSYKQGIRVDICTQEGEKCANEVEARNGYRAICKQNYVYRNLVAYKNGELVTDHFKIPSCCQCILKM